MQYVYLSKTNKDKSAEIFPPLLLKPTYICARAMLRSKKGQQKSLTLKEMTGLCSSRCYGS